MADLDEEITRLTDEFEDCRKLLQALGDETRQRIILRMMQMRRCGGVQASEITEGSHLSRPAVSHHIQILRNAGVVRMRRDGARRYYCFDTKSIYKLLQMLEHAVAIVDQLPNQNAT